MDLGERWNSVISKVFFNLDKHLCVAWPLDLQHHPTSSSPSSFSSSFNSHLPSIEQSKSVNTEKENLKWCI